MIQKLTTFVLALCLFANAYAQDLSSKISQEAIGVISFNFENYSKKIDFSKIQQSAWFKEFDKNIAAQSPESYDFMSKMYKADVMVSLFLLV